MYKISIIMPVYTRGEYYKKNIESILNQTFKDYELICVDDCCHDLQVQAVLNSISRFDNVSVIRNSVSMGAAESRNIGLRFAKGEYVIFLDSDDIFCDCFLEEMYNKITEDESDVCICTFKSFTEKNGVIKIGDTVQIPNDYSEIKEEEYVLTLIRSCPWTKLIKRSFLLENSILFQNLKSCNDVYFSFLSLYLAEKVSLLNEPLIMYRDDSINAISRNKNSYDFYLAIEKLINEIEARHPLNQNYIKSIIYWMLFSVDYELKSCADSKSNIDCLYSCMKLYRKYNFEFIDNTINRKIQIIQLVGMKIYIIMIPMKEKIYCACMNNAVLRRIFYTFFPNRKKGK